MGDVLDTVLGALESKTPPPPDPASLGFPAMLPIEIALKTAPLAELRALYNISPEYWQQLKNDERFRKAVKKACEDAEEDGYSFRQKAKMQAEELLSTSWVMIHDKAVPATVRADMIKTTFRVAGYDAAKSAVGELQPGFAINIHLSGGNAATTSTSKLVEQE